MWMDTQGVKEPGEKSFPRLFISKTIDLLAENAVDGQGTIDQRGFNGIQFRCQVA